MNQREEKKLVVPRWNEAQFEGDEYEMVGYNDDGQPIYRFREEEES